MNVGLIDGLSMLLFGLLGLDTEWSAVVIAAATALVTTLAAAPARLVVDRRLQRSQVEIEYEHEQRKALRAKIGTYHGRLLEAALDMNYRLVNLNLNWKSGWLNVGGEYRAPGQHYLRTTAFRFIRLAGLAHKFEREAIVVDARIAEGNDQAFVRYPKAFRWVMTDVALFGGVEYDPSRSSSHFFTDHLRQMCSLAWASGDEIEFAEFEALVASDDGLDELLEFFDGIEPAQLRWDRLISLQLLLMAFINTFGYEYQRSDAAWFDLVVDHVRHDEIVNALRAWIPKLGLGEDQGTKELDSALARRLAHRGAG
ncbi:MAG: hypothetical protein FVQ78_08630 [Solirubrobacterales bacterium]|nr:hypothetical protein [Solirubrobacterales bacterium]